MGVIPEEGEKDEDEATVLTPSQPRENLTAQPVQEYWAKDTEHYKPPSDFAPEISSAVASASKVFWEKKLSEKRVERVNVVGKTPSNCSFLDRGLKVNEGIWCIATKENRDVDRNLQKVQLLHTKTTSALIKAASALSFVSDAGAGATIQVSDLEKPLDILKDAIKLAGMTNQELLQARREGFKPKLGQDQQKLAKDIPVGSTLLFGDKLHERMEELKEKRELKNAFVQQPKYQYKRKYDSSHTTTTPSKRQSWGNAKDSQKTSASQYQRYDSQNNNNNNNNNKKKYQKYQKFQKKK